MFTGFIVAQGNCYNLIVWAVHILDWNRWFDGIQIFISFFTEFFPVLIVFFRISWCKFKIQWCSKSGETKHMGNNFESKVAGSFFPCNGFQVYLLFQSRLCFVVCFVFCRGEGEFFCFIWTSSKCLNCYASGHPLWSLKANCKSSANRALHLFLMYIFYMFCKKFVLIIMPII